MVWIVKSDLIELWKINKLSIWQFVIFWQKSRQHLFISPDSSFRSIHFISLKKVIIPLDFLGLLRVISLHNGICTMIEHCVIRNKVKNICKIEIFNVTLSEIYHVRCYYIYVGTKYPRFKLQYFVNVHKDIKTFFQDRQSHLMAYLNILIFHLFKALT